MHKRKSHGERKDKKNARMREAVAAKDNEKTPHQTDQKDLVDFKQGSRGDVNQDPTIKHFHHHPPQNQAHHR